MLNHIIISLSYYILCDDIGTVTIFYFPMLKLKIISNVFKYFMSALTKINLTVFFVYFIGFPIEVYKNNIKLYYNTILK